MKMMAARGLAPIADPADFLVVLYQLSIDKDKTVSDSAKTTAKGLPAHILEGALAKKLDARVLDFLAGQKKEDSKVLEKIIFHASTHGDTIAMIAKTGDAEIIGLVATNESKLLAFPKIIEEMYQNPKAPMAIVDRAVELAIRNNVEVGIPAWEEVKQALEQKNPGGAIDEADETEVEAQAAADQTIAKLSSDKVKTDEADIQIRHMTISQKIRLASVGNAFTRSELIRDSKKIVAMAVIKSPAVSDNEVLKYAKDNSLIDDVVMYIANNRQWTRTYPMKLALVMNPKTPLRQTMTFMNFLRPPDLRLVAKSKDVPSAISLKAKQLLKTRNK